MYDYGLSVLEQYGLTASISGRVRGALLCRTEKGPVILREFHGSEKKLAMQQMLLMKLQNEGCHVDTFLENQEGALVSRDKDSIPYTAQIWFDGRECDTKSEADILKSVRILAEIHRKMQLPLEKDYTGRDLKMNTSATTRNTVRYAALSERKGHPILSKKITSGVWNGFWKKAKRQFPCLRQRIMTGSGNKLCVQAVSVMESSTSTMC